MSSISTDYGSPYLTQSWLDSHQGASEVLNSNPEFLSFLTSNPDYAKSFTESAEGAQQAADAAVSAGSLQQEAMDRLLGNASLAMGTMGARDEAMFKDYNEYLTSDWLREHPGAALLLSQRPELADFLTDNPELAKGFTEGREGASQAVEALLGSRPDLGWQMSDLVPEAGAMAMGAADPGQAELQGSPDAAAPTAEGEGLV